MNFFLRLKHWQIFILFLGSPVLFFFLGGITSRFFNGGILSYILPLLAAMSMIFIYFGWLWTIGTLNRYINSELKHRFSIFKFLFRGSLFLAFIIVPILRIIEDDSLIIKVLSTLSFIVFLFCIYLITIVLQNIEKQKFGQINIRFNDFILIWIMPIGIWFIQPRINRIALAIKNREDKIAADFGSH